MMIIVTNNSSRRVFNINKQFLADSVLLLQRVLILAEQLNGDFGILWTDEMNYVSYWICSSIL